MKRPIILAVVCAAFSLNASATDFDKETTLLPETDHSVFDENYSRRFIPYIKLGPEMTNLGKQNTIMPGFGVGIRSESETSAVDCSVSYARVETEKNKYIDHFFVPKLVYLKYLNPHSPSAIFVGFGSAWALINNSVTHQNFNGLAGVLSTGIEYNRNSRIRQIYQLDVHEPLLGLQKNDSWMTPIVEMSFSLGF